MAGKPAMMTLKSSEQRPPATGGADANEENETEE
jgi:hypothetical protein